MVQRPRLTDVRKEDDHDRRQKGDLWFTYHGVPISVEVKCLQTKTVRYTEGKYVGKFQCDASDRREVTLPSGDVLQTTCLVAGEFDLLAVGLFEFGHQWRFAFAKNLDLPRSRYKKYTPEQCQRLLAIMMSVTWPLEAPYRAEPWTLLDEIVQEKRAGASDKAMSGVEIAVVETPDE